VDQLPNYDHARSTHVASSGVKSRRGTERGRLLGAALHCLLGLDLPQSKQVDFG